jgi:hypothetical protein
VTVKDVYALPRVDDSLATLSGNKYFSGLDLFNGYWQIPMAEADKDKTAFITDDGLFEFNVMPFGLTNAPATFQRYMDAILAGLKWNSLLVYIDDIIIFSKTFEDHLHDLEVVLDRLILHNLQLKSSKCHLFQTTLTYLGYVVSENGISPDPAKLTAITAMKRPANITELKSFLGMCSYYRIFIKNFSIKCRPLHELTGNRIFEWGAEQQKAFEELKTEFSSPKILAHPNFDIPFVVETDACDHGLGAALKQKYDGKEHVIQYISRTLSDAERKWTVREKEALAVLWACEKFRVYVAGTEFTLVTDHEALKWLMKVDKPARLVRWALELQEYNFKIIHRSGRANVIADALSRLAGESDELFNPEDNDRLICNLNSFDLINLTKIDIEKAQKEDPGLHSIVLECRANDNRYDRFELADEVLYFRVENQLLLVIPHQLRAVVLKQYHNHQL